MLKNPTEQLSINEKKQNKIGIYWYECETNIKNDDCKKAGYAPYYQVPIKCPKCGADIDMHAMPTYYLLEGEVFDPEYRPENHNKFWSYFLPRQKKKPIGEYSGWGKEGRIRGKLMGKRTNIISRNVIS